MAGSIICGMDGTESAKRAARVARDLSSKLGLRLVFVHVVEAGSPDEKISAIAERLQHLSEGCTEVDCGAAWLVDVGHPVDRLVAVAEDGEASFIVVGSQGPRSSLLGSVSAEVSRRASCPVVVPPGAGEHPVEDDVHTELRRSEMTKAPFDTRDAGGRAEQEPTSDSAFALAASALATAMLTLFAGLALADVVALAFALPFFALATTLFVAATLFLWRWALGEAAASTAQEVAQRKREDAAREADRAGEIVNVRLKRAYEPSAAADGHRVLIDRIWPRGVTREQAHLDEWARELAPSTALRRWFGHDPARFEEFRRRYVEESSQEAMLRELRRRAREGPLTLVYAARDTEHNDAVVLADVLRRGRRSTRRKVRGEQV